MQYLTVEIWAGQPGGQQRFMLSSDDVTIGRDPGNDIVIADPAISPRHARIVRTAGEWLLADEGSADGVWVDGRPYSTVALVHGSRFRIGATTLQFHDMRTHKVVQQRANELRAELGPDTPVETVHQEVVSTAAGDDVAFDDSPTEPRLVPRSLPSSDASPRQIGSRGKTEIDVWTVLGAIAFLALIVGAVASIWEPLLLERIINWIRSGL
jgi:pSer/pThr/pTyr-binding forkhead associated (FHA) protein